MLLDISAVALLGNGRDYQATVYEFVVGNTRLLLNICDYTITYGEKSNMCDAKFLQ